jgi:TonB-linked SusC/RagA family outer membrane protein
MKNYGCGKLFAFHTSIIKYLLMMKLTVALICLFSLQTIANDGRAQERITLDLENTSLKNAFRAIEKQTIFRFVYNDDLIPEKKIDIKVDKQNLDNVMGQLLSNTPLSFRLLNESLVIISIANTPPAFAFEVRGSVTDTTGTPLPGVSIVEKETGHGTSTKDDGTFILSVTSPAAVLQISYVNYMPQEMPVNNRSSIAIQLTSINRQLTDVVVVGFGLSQKKATLSGAISTISSDELSHSRMATTAGALVGRVAGLNFRQTNGRPGSDATVQIRNFGTPLIVIDGVTRDYSSFSHLDVNDIENISILKDASASIYGMQAANGAIVVTTKKGRRNQKPSVTVQSYFGVQKPSGYNKPADAVTYLRAIIQDETYNGVPDNARTVSREEYDKWVNQVDENHKSFDWYKYIWQTAPQYYLSVNLTGGSDNTDYYLSIGNLKQEGLLRNFNGFRRTNFQSNINSTISRRLKVGLSIQGRLEHTDQPGLPGDDYAFAEQTAFRNLPTKRPFANNNPQYPAISSIDPQYSYGWINYNTSGKFVSENRVIQLNGNAELEIVRGFKARALFSYWFRSNKNDLHEKSPILYSYDQATDKYNTAFLGTGRYVERNFQNSEEISSNFQLEYKKSISGHNFQLVSGIEGRQGSYPRLYAVGSPDANGIQNLALRSVTTFTDDISFDQKRLRQFNRFDYDYRNKYILQLTSSYEGSYFYKPGKRFGFFPYGSAAYRISEEAFWRKSKFLSSYVNDFKIRGSYGLTGKELGTALSYITGYNYNQGSAILDGREIITSRVTGLATDNISWGKVYTLDFGVDVTLMQNRLTGSFDWFQRHQTGELASRYDVFLPNEIGFTLPSENLNGDFTRGIEFEFKWQDKIKTFRYWVGGNMTFSRWITGERYKPRWSSEYARYRDLGNTTGRFRDGTFQLIAIGQFHTCEQIVKHPIDQDHYGNTTIRPGDYIYQDINNDGMINDLDMKNVTYRVNNGTPWINFAFNMGANWRGIDFRADFAGGSAFTYEQQSYMRYFDANTNVSQYLADNSTWYKDIWDRNSGFNIGKYPLLTKGVNNWMNTHWPNNYWQTNVTYVKLRNVELGYTFSTALVKRISISSLRVYVAGQNVLAISNMPAELDPEITSNSGISYPNPRIYTAGIQVKF